MSMNRLRSYWHLIFLFALLIAVGVALSWRGTIYLVIVAIAYYVGKAEGLRDGYRCGALSRHPVHQ